MADVFVSYARVDRDRIDKIVKTLSALGLNVWVDARLLNGVSFDDEIAAELSSAKAILVCWSTAASESIWVKHEAGFAFKHKKMAAIRLEQCLVPPPFPIAQTEDVFTWKENNVDHPGWQKVLERIGLLVGRPGLAELARTECDPSAMKLAEWAVKYPSDPFAAVAWSMWESKQRQCFEQELADLTARQSQWTRARQRYVSASVNKLETDFPAWLALKGAALNQPRPDPKAVVIKGIAPVEIIKYRMPVRIAAAVACGAILVGGAAGLWTGYSRAGLSDVATVTTLQTIIGRLEVGLHAAKTEIEAKAEEIRAAQLNVEQGKSVLADMTSQRDDLARDLGKAKIQISGLADRPDHGKLVKLTATIDGLNQELRATKERAEADGVELRAKLDKSSSDAAAIAAQHDAAERELVLSTAEKNKIAQERDESQTVIIQLKGEISDLRRELHTASVVNPAKTSEPPLQEGRSVAECSGYAGHPADQDNKSGKWRIDMADLDLAGVQRAISACRTALGASLSEPLKRQITAQLGRAFLASATRNKRDNQPDAKEDVAFGLKALNEARNQGSAYATSLLGSYYNGAFGPETKDRSKAVDLFGEAAEKGSPVGMTYLAALMLDKENIQAGQTNALSSSAQKRILSLLERAEGMKYSKAFVIHAGAYLDDRMFPGLSTEERRRNAAATAEKAACFGTSAEADAFFEKNGRVKPYRNPQASCATEG